jgi:copper(I)-binding protein
VLNIGPDSEKASTTVRVINNTDEPLTLSTPECNNRNFAVEVTEVKTNKPGKEFLMTVSTLPPLSQGTTISGQVSVKTSSTNVPVLNFSAIAIIQSPVVVAPPQIRLAQGPLPNAVTNSFTIQNNSTNSLKLSDAAASVKGVGVEIKETQPGKLFNALVSFPQGFETTPGQPVTVTIKSSNARVPLIKVPVEQPSRPAAMQQAVPPPSLSAKTQAAAAH